MAYCTSMFRCGFLCVWCLSWLLFAVVAAHPPSGSGAHRTAGRGQFVTNCKQLLSCIGTGSQMMGCVSWYPIIEGWPPACCLGNNSPGLVVLVYKGSSDFFVGYIDRGFIINTHPPGKRKNGRVRLCMYRYIRHIHSGYF